MKISRLKRHTVSGCLAFLYATLLQGQDSGYYTSFDETRIHYKVMGTGQPVLLIHGFTGTADNWKDKPVTDSLLAHGYKTILVDLRGNGLSDLPESPEKYANNAEARDLKGLMEYLGFKRYAALGYSRGSIILASLLILDPQCKKAVMGGMGADFTNPEWPRRIGFYKALMNDTIAGYEGFRNYIAEKGLNPRVLASQQKEQPATPKEALAGLKIPVLILCGTEDTDNGKGQELQALIPGSEFAEVPGTHNTALSTPEFAAKAVEFLDQ